MRESEPSRGLPDSSGSVAKPASTRSSAFLEVGHTERPLGHSLLLDPPTKPVIEAPKRSSILDKLENFLPKLSSANAELEKRLRLDPKVVRAVNIEHVEEDCAEAIEMDIAVVPTEERVFKALCVEADGIASETSEQAKCKRRKMLVEEVGADSK